MKKLSFLVFLALGLLTQAQVTFNPGIRAGANFAKFTETDSGVYDWFDDNYTEEVAKMSFITDFYIGFQGNIRFSKLYALQPEINYSRQGSQVEYENMTSKPKISYLSIQAVNKFYFNQFNIHVGPAIDFMIDKNFNPSNRTDLSFLLGLGYDISKNFGIEARVKKGIIPVASTSYEDHTNVLIQTGIYYTFNTK